MEGYAKIASRVVQQPELAILRRFKSLNAQNLLYMQAELVDLEIRLREQAEADAATNDTTKKLYSRDWYTLSKTSADGAHSEQWELVLLLRDRLEQYSNEANQLVRRDLADSNETGPCSTSRNSQGRCRRLQNVTSTLL